MYTLYLTDPDYPSVNRCCKKYTLYNNYKGLAWF